MRKKIPDELSVKVVSVDFKSLQYIRVVLIRVKIRTTISVYSTKKKPHEPRLNFLGPRFHTIFFDFFLKISMHCSSKLSQNLFYIHLLLIRKKGVFLDTLEKGDVLVYT